MIDTCEMSFKLKPPEQVVAQGFNNGMKRIQLGGTFCFQVPCHLRLTHIQKFNESEYTQKVVAVLETDPSDD